MHTPDFSWQGTHAVENGWGPLSQVQCVTHAVASNAHSPPRTLPIQAEIWIFYFTWQGAGGFQKALNKCQVTRGMHSRMKCNADICQALDSRTVGCQPDKGQQSSGFEPLEALKSYRFMAVPLGSFSSTQESRLKHLHPPVPRTAGAHSPFGPLRKAPTWAPQALVLA